jgi:type IV pilus assembly protein PilE
MRNIKGFTLIEMMIVVAILGIIGSIAFASYQDSVRKTKRAEAKTALMDLAQRLERGYTANGAYNTANSVHDGAALLVATTPTGYYNLAIGNLAATTYTLTAAGTFDDPQCDIFTVLHTGAQTAVDDAAVDSTGVCW